MMQNKMQRKNIEFNASHLRIISTIFFRKFFQKSKLYFIKNDSKLDKSHLQDLKKL